MYRFKFWIHSKNGKVAIAVMTTILITILVIIPIVYVISFRTKINIYAYNRDANSGTREAFENSIDFNEGQQYSKNVLEVNGNDTMLDRVQKTESSIGYISYSTAFDEQGDPVEGIKILNFNDTDYPTPENQGLIDQYDAKRPFNMFLRINEETAQEVAPFMFPYDESLDGDYSSLDKDSTSIWASNYSDNDDFVNITNDREARFVVSFLFYNWVLYSQEALNLLSFGYGDYPRDDFSLYVENYITNTGLKSYLENDSNYGSKSNPLKIQTQGSTSVLSTLNLLMDDPEQGFIQELDADGVYINHEPLHVGSSDAFKDDVVGSEDVFLGFQSRGMKENEAQGWGYSGYQLSEDGFYSQDYYNQAKSDDLMYVSFETDAILFIINANTSFTISDGATKVPTGISSQGVNFIYTENASWLDLYNYGAIDYEGINV